MFLYHPRERGVPIVATLRALLPRTEERRVSDQEVVVAGMVAQPHATARQAVEALERSEPGWREFVAIRLGDVGAPL